MLCCLCVWVWAGVWAGMLLPLATGVICQPTQAGMSSELMLSQMMPSQAGSKWRDSAQTPALLGCCLCRCPAV